MRKLELPDFPWDRLLPAHAKAAQHPGGVVDLSIGTPVDSTPPAVAEALVGASDAPGYPLTAGTPALRAAIAGWFQRRLSISVAPDAVLPTLGSKELVAWLPTLLGLGPGDVVVHPALAYPTYDVGARLAGATPVASDSLTHLDPSRVGLIWLNSPANPHGEILGEVHMRKVVEFARGCGAVVASDECYLEFGWDGQPISVLDPRVCGDSHDGVLAVHSLSKRSNLAGYRAGFVAGDPGIVGSLREARKHAGMMMPTPVQAAMVAALSDDEHVRRQWTRYHSRRTVLLTALQDAGFRVDHSEGSLYLWAARGEGCWDTVDWFARRGIVVAPGEFYGPAGAEHVRVSLTASDEHVAEAAARLRQ